MAETLANFLKNRVEALGYPDIKQCAQDLKLPYELLRKVITHGHIPKDQTLIQYAERLTIHPDHLLRIAYRQKVPLSIRHWFDTTAQPPQPADESTRLLPVLGTAQCARWFTQNDGTPSDYQPSTSRDPNAFFVMADLPSMAGDGISLHALLLVSPAINLYNGSLVFLYHPKKMHSFQVRYYFKSESMLIMQALNSTDHPLLLEKNHPWTLLRVIEIRNFV